MGLFNRNNDVKTSPVGNDVRSADDIYYDQEYSRKRTNPWKETLSFKYSPLVVFLAGAVVFELLAMVALSLLLIMLNGLSGMFSGPNAVFLAMGIPFVANPFLSVYIFLLASVWTWGLSFVASGIGALMWSRYQQRIHVFNTDEDINSYEGDAAVMTVPEMVAKYKPVPDQGAHFKDVDVTGLVSHIGLNNQGLGKWNLPVLESIDGLPKGEAEELHVRRMVGFRVKIPKDITLQKGMVIKATMIRSGTNEKPKETTLTIGEKGPKEPFAIVKVKPKSRMVIGRMYQGREVIVEFPDGQKVKAKEDTKLLNKTIRKDQKLIDEKDAITQFNNVGMRDKKLQKLHNPKKLYVNEAQQQTMSDYIKENWYIPDYETQKPSGAYLVDESPINVMIVAMTRGNKGQCMINPTIDMWTRQDKKVNIFCNDPKGELYTGFFATLKMRGFEVVVFNLLDPYFTDQFNPLAEAITYVRKGYKDETQKVLENLAANFFPMPEGQEPVWTEGERMLFQMLCLVLMDVYFEEEQEYLRKYSGVYDEAQIQRDLDEMWGNVTLPNAYRMVSVLATRKFQKKQFDGGPIIDPDTGQEIPPEEENMLEKLFELTGDLPRSTIRELFSHPYSNLMSMADSEKMRSSIYGMALTEMSFFVQGPVVSLTSASPKRSFDLVSMSFPRRFSFKFDDHFIRDKGWMTMMVKFELYRDPYFMDKYEGEEYEHVTRIDKLSWVEMRFEAVLDQPITYVKMIVHSRGSQQQMTYGTFYAQFTKGYQKSADGRTLLKDPITGEYQVRDGILRMGVMKDIDPSEVDSDDVDLDRFNREDITQVFSYAQPQVHLNNGDVVNAIVLSEVAYMEKPMAVFSVTPPSSLIYVKIILMIIHNMFNTTVENSYMTKDNGKPLLATKYMLDEAGNLSYQGSGIDSLQTKLSIGLGQEQQMTLVFQTLQQITDIYGDTADRIISSNTGLSAFLLSNDLDMLETMSEQAGKRHVGRRNNKTVTKNVGTLTNHIEDAVSYSTTTEEEPLFSVNRLLRMTNGESLMLSTTKRKNNDGSNARQQPVFNTKDTSLPMAFSLHKYGYGQRSHSMLTVPATNSTVSHEEQVPPFESIIYKRAAQAAIAPGVIDRYKEEHNLTDIEYDLLDSKEVGPEIMGRINHMLDLLNELSPEAKDDLRQEVAQDEGSDETLRDEIENISGDRNYTREDLDRAVHEDSGVRFKHGKDGQPVIQDMTDDSDVKEENKRTEAEARELDEKTLGNGRFSKRDMGAGPMRTAMTQALDILNRDYLSSYPDWELDISADPVTLKRNGQVMATKKKVQQNQSVEMPDGNIADSRQVKSTSWELEPSFINLLLETKDWEGLIGKPYVNKVNDLFHASEETVKGMRSM